MGEALASGPRSEREERRSEVRMRRLMFNMANWIYIIIAKIKINYFSRRVWENGEMYMLWVSLRKGEWRGFKHCINDR